MSQGESFSGQKTINKKFNYDFQKCLSDGNKPLLHKIICTENVSDLLKEKLKYIYFNSFYLKNETLKIEPKFFYTVEPRFSLGRSESIKTLSEIVKIKIEKYKIKQVVAPGSGGVCAINTFLMSSEKNINWAMIKMYSSKDKRLKTNIEGYLNKNLPVWLTDDLLASGKAAIESIKFLHYSGYYVAGFIPLFVHLNNNVGHRVFENITNHSTKTRFIYDYIVGMQHPPKTQKVNLYKFRKDNSILYDN